MKNVELMVQMLRNAGVKYAFGIPSGPVLPFIDACRTGGIEYVLTANETSAGFMASAMGALTGVPGVGVSTLGPGATNLATGAGAAWLDAAPMIAITCNVNESMLERRVQMRIDHHQLFGPISKASFGLRRGYVAEPLAEAITLAKSERPGTVHIDLPEDTGSSVATESVIEPASPPRLPAIPQTDIARLGELLRQSKRPLVIGGLGLTRASNAAGLISFIEKQNLPFILTLHAKGFLPESHANYCGVLGRARRSDVQKFVDRADLIVAVGYDEIEINYEEWAASIPVAHVSNLAGENSEAVNFVLNTNGDLEGGIEAMNRLPAEKHDWKGAEFAAHRATLAENLRPSENFSAHHVLDALQSRLSGNDVLAYDVGAHTHQIATQWRTDVPNTCISTNGWSSMGYGIPAALAAKMADPDRKVVGLIGDGCFQMTVGELGVAKRQNLALPIVVLNDGWLSLLKVKQERKGYPLSGVDLGERPPSPPHYFGVPCRGVKDPAELEGALDWALSLDGPSVIEAFTDASEYSTTVYD